jgi:MFS family permease
MGLVLGPALGAVSISLLGQYETFILSSCIGFFGVSLSCVLNTRDIQTDVKQLETIRMKEIPEVLANQSFQKSFLAYFAFSFMYGVVLGYVPVRAQQDFGFSEAQITALFFGYFLVVVSSRFFVGRLVAKFSEGNSLLVGLLTGGVFTLMVSASVHSIHFSLAFILLGICHGIVFPVSAMIIAKSVPLRNLTLSNSLYLISFDAGATVGPLVASAAVFLWGIRVAIAVSAVPFFLNIPLVIRKKQVKPSD